MTQIMIVPSSPKYMAGMEDVEHANYGTSRAEPEDVLTEQHFRHHLQIFPEGQFVALEIQPDGGDRVVGLTASMRIQFDPAHPFLESWEQTIDGGWLRKHDPHGEWLYGVESAVLPGYQGHGIGGKLMQARFDVAKRLNLRGMVAGSAIISYYQHKELSVEDYVQAVIEGRIFDQNLSKQMKKGFKPLAPIPDYVDDWESLGWGVLMVWMNPDYRASQTRQAAKWTVAHPI